MSVYIIAEAGVNHNGNYEVAKQMIEQAKWAGCDCIKFQSFKAENLVTKDAPMAKYQIKNLNQQDSQFNMLKKLELSQQAFINLKNYAASLCIDFLSTPFDEASAEDLYNLGVTQFKVSSGDLTNKPLLQKLACYNKRLLISTGMADLNEIDEAVQWVYTCGNRNVVLFHCTTNYPTPYEDVNMNAMLTLKKRYNLPVGYSDHTEGIEIALMAVSMGAIMIEKHFTLDKTMPGPDQKASLEPGELKKMVDSIRNIEKAFGTGDKVPTLSEQCLISAARKSLVYTRDIYIGETIQPDDIICKRPGNGILPKYKENIIGKTVKKNCYRDTLVKEGDV